MGGASRVTSPRAAGAANGGGQMRGGRVSGAGGGPATSGPRLGCCPQGGVEKNSSLPRAASRYGSPFVEPDVAAAAPAKPTTPTNHGISRTARRQGRGSFKEGRLHPLPGGG